MADTSYGIELKLNGRPRKDTMSFRMFTERDSAYDIVIAACERYGIYVEKR